RLLRTESEMALRARRPDHRRSLRRAVRDADGPADLLHRPYPLQQPFASAETSFLLAAPVAADQGFAYKFQGAVVFSRWAFVLLGSPVLLAYGLQVGDGAPWYFYVALPLFFLGFVLLPGSLGALLCLLLVTFLPRRRKQLVLTVILVGGVG